MKMTLEMLLYLIRELDPVVCHMPTGEQAFVGVKQFYREEDRMQPEYVYVGRLSEVQSETHLCEGGTILAMNDLGCG